MPGYTGAERKRLAAALAAGSEPRCPACREAVSVREVPRPEEVSYVRRRVWVLCPSCRRTGAVDVREGGPP